MHFRSPLPKLLAATIAACALAPAAAHAATISMENGTLTYRGEGAEGLSLNVTQTVDNTTNAKLLRFSDYGADRLSIATAVCQPEQYATGSVVCTFDVNRPIAIEGSEAKDSISLFSAGDVPDSIPVTIDGKGGDDTIKDTYDGLAARRLLGGGGNDTIEGYGGDDYVDGGDGSDTVDGGAGNDEVHGGNGDDVLWGDHYKDPGADLIDGGPGNDQIDEWSIPSGDFHPLASVSLNGAADDGRPGEGDNVIAVEKYTYHVNGSFTGSDADENVQVVNITEGAANLDGAGGNDVLKAGDTSDTIAGGAGDDQLEGGLGNDTVTGGPGKDTIMGDASSSYCSIYQCKVPYGNDTIQAQDGEVDQIDCGVGQDTAYVDPIDVVNNCEAVIKGAAAGAPAPGNGGAAGSVSKKAGKGLTLLGAAKVKALLGGKLAVNVPCAAACRVAVVARSAGKAIAGGKGTLLKAGTARVRLKVAQKAKRSVKRAKVLKLTLTATVTGADGKPHKLTKTVTLKK